MLALENLRVLDVTQVLAGPFCTQLLGDMGADVLKIEPPGRGDQSRKAMGYFAKGADTVQFLAVNRNKKSLTLNLKTPEGQEVFHRLVRDADVVVENYRPGVTTKLGIDYPTLREVNPRIVYASISGFGQTGPYAARGGHDLIAQGMSGVMSVTGEPGGRPAKAGLSVGDLSAGLFCAFGILAACVARERTGRGQWVDTSIFESPLALSIFETAELWATGNVPRPLGSGNRTSAPNQAFAAGDGYLTICATNQRLWTRLCEVLDREDLAADQRFRTNLDRMSHQRELAEQLEITLRTRSAREWVTLITAAGIPAGPIHNYQEVLDDPHTRDREMVVEMEHPVEGTIRGLGIPVKLSDTPGAVRRAAPLLGEHTAATLAGIGFTAEQINDLADRGII
jgi:crotonobetainyl-CoA:carnitine CoA-transferase CaiB-like acyl-CoA transferase